jgi:hypothetical protein
MVGRGGIQADCYRLGKWKMLFMFLSGLVSVLLITGHGYSGAMAATIQEVTDSNNAIMSSDEQTLAEYIDIMSSTEVYQDYRRRQVQGAAAVSASATTSDNGQDDYATPSLFMNRGVFQNKRQRLRETQSCTNPGDTIDCDEYADSQCDSCCWTDENGNAGVKNDDGSEMRWCWSRTDANKKRKACICGEPPYASQSSCLVDDESVAEDPAPGYCKSYLCCSQLCRCTGTQGDLDCRCF